MKIPLKRPVLAAARQIHAPNVGSVAARTCPFPVERAPTSASRTWVVGQTWPDPARPTHAAPPRSAAIVTILYLSTIQCLGLGTYDYIRGVGPRSCGRRSPPQSPLANHARDRTPRAPAALCPPGVGTSLQPRKNLRNRGPSGGTSVVAVRYLTFGVLMEKPLFVPENQWRQAVSTP